MTKSAIVLELNSSYATLLTDEGVFLRIHVSRLPGARYVGQDVNLDNLKPLNYGRWVSIAAACLVFLIAIPVLAPAPVHAWVTLDGAASLEITVNNKYQIVDVRALNGGGQDFLAVFGSDNLSFTALLESYRVWSDKQGDSTILVTYSAESKSLHELLDPRQSDSLIVLAADSQARDEAEILGISTGRALLLAEANSQGISIPLDNIRETNPISVLSSSGADVKEAVAGTATPGNQADKIKDLPRPEPKEPDDRDQGQAGQEKDSNPPGHSDSDKTPPGQDKDNHPPGQTGNNQTPPGQDNQNDPPGQSGSSNTPPGQAKKDIPGSVGNDNPPPGLAKKDTLPPVVLEKFSPNPKEAVSVSWKEERTGPPFVSSSANNGKSNQGNNGKGKNK